MLVNAKLCQRRRRRGSDLPRTDALSGSTVLWVLPKPALFALLILEGQLLHGGMSQSGPDPGLGAPRRNPRAKIRSNSSTSRYHYCRNPLVAKAMVLREFVAHNSHQSLRRHHLLQSLRVLEFQVQSNLRGTAMPPSILKFIRSEKLGGEVGDYTSIMQDNEVIYVNEICTSCCH